MSWTEATIPDGMCIVTALPAGWASIGSENRAADSSEGVPHHVTFIHKLGLLIVPAERTERFLHLLYGQFVYSPQQISSASIKENT